ncbi:hypothetical protein SE15_06585 [Thermanaerothrix daxensis]|uniref:Hydrogenase maturation protease n=2 Tax=Thermanaerothrix daxensis TaxID=869279 RepID=A0A0P6Y7A6_9CHLR|nr:hypothetical protein SE15_06585 [Thermanaerothrix daxensis]
MAVMKTFNSSWSEPLRDALEKQRRALNLPADALRLAFVGVGNELNGDDGAGLWIVRGLKWVLPQHERLLLVEAGIAPENFTGVLRRFEPNWVLWVDAADMNQAPGAVSWVMWEGAEEIPQISTHTLSPGLLGHYLGAELGCQMGIIGIQPVSLRFGEGLTPAVRRSVRGLVRFLAAWVGDCFKLHAE